MTAVDPNTAAALAQYQANRDLIGQMVRAQLPQTVAAQGIPMIGGRVMDPAVAQRFIDTMRGAQNAFPETVRNFAGFEPTVRNNSLAETVYRPGEQYAFGLNPNYNLNALDAAAATNQITGWHTTPVFGDSGGQIPMHEFGHAIDRRLEKFLEEANGTLDRRVAKAQAAYSGLRQDLAEEALSGNISEYAKKALISAAKAGTNPGPDGLRAAILDASPAEGAATMRAALAPRSLRNWTAEPFAEAFARDPAMLTDVYKAATDAGWRGSAEVGTLGKGLGLGAGLLAGQYLANRVGGPTGSVLQGATTGAGLGGMLGWEGALGGAAIGGGLALAHQLFK